MNLEYGINAAAEVRSACSLALRPYQVEAVARCIQSNTLLNLDMGLGKSLCAVAATRHLENRIFIIPKTTRWVWFKELYRAAGVTEIIELEGVKRLRAVRTKLGLYGIESTAAVEGSLSGVFVVSHESVSSWADTLPTHGNAMKIIVNTFDPPPVQLPSRFDAVVIDESHQFGNKNSKRAMGAKRFVEDAYRVLLLSGTPDLGGTERLWFQLVLLGFPIENYWDFITRYCGAQEVEIKGRTILKTTRGTNLSELAERTYHHILSYSQEQVASFLPKHTRERIVVPLTGVMAKAIGSKLAAARKKLLSLGELGGETDRLKFLPGEVIQARMVCAMAKVSAVVDVVEELVHKGERVVVWAWHRSVVHDLAVVLKEKKVRSYTVMGGDATTYVDVTINQWTREGGALIATIAKLGEGEDRLVAAAWQLFIEVDWLPQTVRQAEKRLLRLSQTRPVNTRFFQLEMPFERSLMDRLLDRADDTDTLFGSSSSIDIGALFGVKLEIDTTEALKRLNERFG